MASDRDTTPFMYALFGDGTAEFGIDLQTGVIRTLRLLDYEQRRQYPNLVLIVFDVDFLNSTVPLSIQVQDENDNTPTFVPDVVQLSISESTPLGSEIFVAMATDLDDTTNAQLLYSLSVTGDFLINFLSGAITVDAELDFETQESYLLVITATDRGSPTRSSTLTLNVTLLDQNDNAPVITNPSPVYTIRENVNTGQLVGTVNAVDADSGINSALVFAIRAGNMANRFFIHPETGNIFTNATIDREVQSVYSLTVEVKSREN